MRTTGADNFFDTSFPLSRIAGSTTYEVGDTVIIPTSPSNNECAVIQMNFEGVDGATSGPGFLNQGTDIDPSVIGSPEIDTAQIPSGGTSTSSMLFDGSTDGLSFADSSGLEFLSGEATIHGHFRLGATGVIQTLASKFNTSGSQRSWILTVTAANVLQFVVYDTGSTIDITLLGTTGLTTGVNYHVAVVRKGDGDWEMWLGGVNEAGPTTPTGDVFDSTAPIRLGVGDADTTDFFNGWLDSWEIVRFARWAADFTPPTGNLSATNPTVIWEDFGDRVYEVTTAGTTNACTNAPNPTIGGTHSQGSAVLTANHSWMRFAQVTAVNGSDPRRIFTVAELTPTSGEAVGANRLPSSLGFPNDWFNGGAAFFESGVNDGRGLEVRDFSAGAGSQVIELLTDMPFDIEVGDKLRIFAGCDKTETTCITKFANPVNAVAEWFVPGEDTLGQYPDAR